MRDVNILQISPMDDHSPCAESSLGQARQGRVGYLGRPHRRKTQFLAASARSVATCIISDEQKCIRTQSLRLR